MTRILMSATVAIGLGLVALALHGGPARGEAAQTVVLGAGDVMEVEGAPIGCKVARRDGRLVIDCRRAGRLAGTYGTLFDARRVRVTKFKSSDTAKVVFRAKHRGRARRCDDRASAAAHGDRLR
jgi:hypothetical protein